MKYIRMQKYQKERTNSISVCSSLYTKLSYHLDIDQVSILAVMELKGWTFTKTKAVKN